MSYYNTTGLIGNALLAAIDAADTHEGKVKTLFNEWIGRPLTPCEVHSIVTDDATPLTSTRRAMSDLTNEGVLIKTDERRVGIYGSLNHTWRRNR